MGPAYEPGLGPPLEPPGGFVCGPVSTMLSTLHKHGREDAGRPSCSGANTKVHHPGRERRMDMPRGSRKITFLLDLYPVCWIVCLFVVLCLCICLFLFVFNVLRCL